MKNHRTIYREASVEISIEKSRFIGYITPVVNESDAILFIEKIKKKHWDATHNVPVYVIGENFGIQRYSDDGEPSGTAGVPILEMLKKEGITNICVVITRYFGGVKLGTGGLVRAYTQSAKAALEAAQVVDMKIYKQLSIKFEYHFHGKLQNYFLNEPNIIVKDTQFTDCILCNIYVEPQFCEVISEKIVELTSGQIVIEILDEVYLTIKDNQVLES